MQDKGATMSHVLDVKGLACPLPVLRAKKAMKPVPPGDVLEVLATDPGTPTPQGGQGVRDQHGA